MKITLRGKLNFCEECSTVHEILGNLFFNRGACFNLNDYATNLIFAGLSEVSKEKAKCCFFSRALLLQGATLLVTL